MNNENRLVEELKRKRETLSTAESCTGGLVAGTIVNVSGASSVFNEGYITYANASKIKILGVGEDVLQTYGAVSKECAKAMAEGCAKNANAQLGLSATGIAGPDGGTKEKPVGLVYLGCYYKGETVVEKHIFSGNREEIRRQSVSKVIDLALNIVTLNN